MSSVKSYLLASVSPDQDLDMCVLAGGIRKLDSVCWSLTCVSGFCGFNLGVVAHTVIPEFLEV